jgi:hypothetical protein
MQKITQIHMSSSVKFFSEKIKERYKLVNYYNSNKPAIFWGMYRDEDVEKLITHKSHSVVVWRGSDAMGCKKYANKIKKVKNIKHISISNFIKNSLSKNGINSELLPIRPTNNIKNIKPRGNKIYFYHGRDTKHFWDFYGGEMVDEIKKRIPYEIVTATKDKYTEQQLQKIYESCFLGLRLTKHDGIANTVCEMGLMGRMCIHNGDIPNSIKYNTVDDIVRIINQEYNNRNNDNTQIGEDVYNYLNIKDDWLYI